MDSVAPFAGLLLGQPTLRRRIKLGSFAALLTEHQADPADLKETS